jgi:hypothetical protein
VKEGLLLAGGVALFAGIVVASNVAIRGPGAEDGDGRTAAAPAGYPLWTTAPLRLEPSDPGYKLVANDDGGWSMRVPVEWTTQNGSPRGADMASFDVRGAPLSGNAPAAGQLRLTIALTPESDRLSLEALGARGVPSWLVFEQNRTKVAGRDAVRTIRRANQPANSPLDLLHVVWTLRSPYFMDRAMVIDAWPADGALRGEAERAVATMKLFAPILRAEAPVLTRTEAIARAPMSGHRVDRAAARLVLFKEYMAAQAADAAKTPGAPVPVPGAAPDLDELFWVVVVAGDLGTMPMGGPPGPGATPAPMQETRWIMSVLSAADGTMRSGIWSATGDWPTWFDDLPDRSP